MIRAVRSRGSSISFVVGVAALFAAAPAATAQSGIAAWGDDSSGQCNVPALPPGLTYVEVDAGGAVTAARRSDGSVVVWGSNAVGSCDVPALPSGVTYVEVEAGEAHVVARRSDGSVVAWGSNVFRQCGVPSLPPGLTYVEIAAGLYHTLARRSDGSVVAWGLNWSGECYVLPLPAGLTYVEVAAGGVSHNFGAHSLARRSDGSIVGWGSNGSGECDAPALPAGVTYVEIEAAESYSVARRSDGSVVMWGACYGMCDVPDLPSGVTYTDIAAGYMHMLGLRSDGSVVAWGSNGYGQSDVPPLPTGLRYVEVAANYGHSAARIAGCPTCEPPFCHGDGSDARVACPCGNYGLGGRGCENSATTGGAKLTVHGSIDPDSVELAVLGELPSALSIFLQGSSVLADGVTFGDGVRCTGGTLTRVGVASAVGGRASYPGPGDPSISARSAALGDPIPAGSYRHYQVYYRDFDPVFCNASPATFNASNAVMVAW